MKSKNELEQYLEVNQAVETSFNTCNAWGFGGGIGTSYALPNGYSVRVGTAYYRHIKSHGYITMADSNGHRIFDENNSIKYRKMAIDLLKSI